MIAINVKCATFGALLLVACGSESSAGSGVEGGAATGGGAGVAGSVASGGSGGVGGSSGASGSGGSAGASGSGGASGTGSGGGSGSGSGGSAGASGSGSGGGAGASGSGSGGGAGASGSGGSAGVSGSGGTSGSGGAAGTGGSAGSGGGSLPWFTGVNLSCAEFGESNLPGTYDTHYTYPTHAEVDYFMAQGMTLLRVPFRWERLQHAKQGALDATELGRLDDTVGYATGKGLHVLFDPHNYARYYGELIGSASVSNADYADFWAKLADHYQSNALAIFGLMNEPHDLPTEQWLAAANAGIAGIRSTGATQLITVPGNDWTGGHSWSESWYGTPNSQVMGGVVDSGNNFAFELHQYLDDTYAGSDPACQSATIGSEKLAGVTSWLRTRGYRGLLGEFGGGDNVTCHAAVTDVLMYLEANADVWLGWAWWAAGPWWGDYFLTLEPQNIDTTPIDAPQLDWLKPFL